MDTDEEKTKLNKKAAYLLMILGIFGFLCFKFTKVSIAEESTKNPESCGTVSTQNSATDTNLIFFNSEDGTTTDISPVKSTGSIASGNGSVLGTTCSIAENTYEANTACTLSSNRISVDGSGLVNSSASIELVSVSIPVRLLSGKYSIADSNRLITLTDYVYKPAGSFFTGEDLERNTAPGEIHDEVVASTITSAIKKTAYGTKYTISTNENSSGDGEVVIDKYATNDCEKCNNPANSNPDESNNIAKYLKSVFWDYPNQKEEDSTTGSSIVMAGSCKNTEEVSANTDTVTTCINVWTALVGTFSSLFPSSDWTQCAAGGENCVKAEDIAIKMSPMFTETNAYTKTRNKIAADPTTSASYTPTYVVTKCIASVGGKLTNVKCLWDMSYMFDEREFSQYKDAGGSNTPTKEQYTQFLQEESSMRTDPLVSM